MEIKIQLDNPTNTCFVVMPFSNTFNSEYEKVIVPAIEENNVKCVRGDEIYSKQRIMDDIWKPSGIGKGFPLQSGLFWRLWFFVESFPRRR